MRSTITTVEQLRGIIGTPTHRSATKDTDRLDDEHRAFLAASPFCLVATSGADGTCDVSPKGDPPGFAHVIDDRTLAIPERPGNRRADGYLNVLENPHVGLVFVVPGRGETLRVNGRATLLADAPYADEMVVKEHRPLLICEVAIEQVFFHCVKAFMRSRLWEPESWPRRSKKVPAYAKVLY